MSKFLDDIEAAIATIHTNNGVDNATVTKEITDAVTAGVAPLQTQINELQKALQDTVAALNNGDTAAAHATATAAATAAAAGSNLA